MTWTKSIAAIAVTLAISSQAAIGDGAALDRWHAALDPVFKERYDKARKDRGLRYLCPMLHEPHLIGEQYEEQRRKLSTLLRTGPLKL